MGLKTTLPSLIIKTAFIKEEIAVEGKVPVVVNSHVDQYDGNPEDVIYVFILSPNGMPASIPKKGTKGLVIFDNLDIRKGEGYWIGATFDRFDRNQHVEMSTSIAQLASDNKKARIASSDTLSGMFFGENKVTVSNDGLVASYKGSMMNFTSKGISLSFKDSAGEPKSYLQLSSTKAELATTGSLVLNAFGNYAFRTNNNFSITGVMNPKSTKKGDEQYSPCDMFFVKARKVMYNITKGPFMVNAGNMSIKLAGGKIGGGGGTPGNGPKYSFNLKVIDGPMLFEAGSGNIEITANNKLQKDKIMIQCGNEMVPLKSNLEMTGQKIKLMNALNTKNNSYLELGFTKATLYAFGDLTLTSKAGNIKASALKNVEIEAMIDMKLKALKLAIEANVEMAIKTATLNLTEAKVIDTGTKMVPPTGIGCFNAINFCPITGVSHSGSKAIG